MSRQPSLNSNRLQLSDQQASTALRVAIKILQLWGVLEQEQSVILGFNRKNLTEDQMQSALSKDQLSHISLILDIHATLRSVFSNPANQHGFMRMRNNNSFFNGRTPIEIVGSGELKDLYETWHRIKSLEQPM
ncbi:MAG: hypothetical protein WA929_06090 [Pseudomonas neustonica]|tara:strand:- start:1179 stop:1577 length:399 start_codon:yes stop_codon:yes gene_type:complete